MSTKTKDVQSNDVVILAGVTLAEEKKKGGGSLWSLPDGNYPVQIISRREDFKGGKVAVVTTMGITTVANLFLFATPEVVKDHTSAKGEVTLLAKESVKA